MKKFLVFLLIVCSFKYVQANIEKIDLVSSSNFGVEIEFDLGEFYFEDFNYNGNLYQKIITDEVLLPAEKGAPDLPSFSSIIAIPKNASVSVEIEILSSEKYNEILPVPAPEIPFIVDDRDLSYVENISIYQGNNLYPENIIKVSDVWQIRGVDVVTIAIIPFIWNPVNNNLEVFKNIKIKVNFENGNAIFGEDRLRTRNWDKILSKTLLNFNILSNIDYSKRVETFLSDGRDNAEFVIIVPDDPDFIAWGDSIKKFRSEEGIISEVFTLTDIGGTSATIIESWIDNAYNNWSIPPEAILILSDYPSSSDAYGVISPTVSHPYSGTCVSDIKYADVVGGDYLPEITIARITAQNEDELRIMIEKDFLYERNPPTDVSFYNTPILAIGYQTERWFQLFGEVLYGFLSVSLGKTPLRLYDVVSGSPVPGGSWSSATNTSTVVNYFNNLGYIDMTIPAGIDWHGGNATTINNAINTGSFLIQHMDHGAVTAWVHPSYTTTDLNGLNNTDRIWPFVYSTNCSTGEFNASTECFVEKMHRLDGKGALGLNAASEVSYSFVSDVFIWGSYDYMWQEFIPGYSTKSDSTDARPAFANVYGCFYLEQSSWPYNTQHKEITYKIFHHFGDPYMRLFTEVPQTLSVNHPPTITGGLNFLTVSAPVNSYIALTVDGELIGRAEGTGSSQNVTIDPQTPGTTVKLVITKQDYYRYDVDLDVIPASGAYVAYAYTDTIIGGYNNGQVNAGQTYDLTLAIANWGSVNATGVQAVINSTDGNITVTTDTVDFGTVNANDTVVGTSAYEVILGNSIVDGYNIPIDMTCWDTYDSTWESSFYILVNAPDLSLWAMNGPAEVLPGDNFYMCPKLENEGSGTAFNLDLTIRTDDSYGSVTDSTESMSSILPGDISWHDSAFQVSISASTPEPYFMDFELEVQMSGGYSYCDTITVGIGSVVFSEDFESGGTGWTYTGSTSWHLTEHDSYSATHSMYCGQEGSWAYVNSLTNSRTMSPQFTVGAGAGMSFWHRYDIENEWDGAQMQITTNNGSTWATIDPDEGYTGTSRGYGGYSTGDPIWTGHGHTVWEERHHTFTISGDVNVCWRFGSDGSVTYEGYYFDDVLVGVESGFLGVEEELTGPVAPTGYQFALHRAYPNPVRGRAMILYSVGSEAPVRLVIYDVTGREVSILVNQVQTAGNYKIEWDGRDNRGALVSSGTYFYRLEAGSFNDGSKLVVVR